MRHFVGIKVMLVKMGREMKDTNDIWETDHVPKKKKRRLEGAFPTLRKG